MARSSYVYNVWAGAILLGSFTVKRECLDAIERYEAANPGALLRITRVRDGALGLGLFARVPRE